MYVVTSKVMANRNRIEKYVFYDTVTNGMILKTPAEANQLLDKNMVAGLHKHGAGSAKPTSYFKHIGVIGEKDVKAYKTVISLCKYIPDFIRLKKTPATIGISSAF